METEKGTEIETKRETENWKKGSEKKNGNKTQYTVFATALSCIHSKLR